MPAARHTYNSNNNNHTNSSWYYARVRVGSLFWDWSPLASDFSRVVRALEGGMIWSETLIELKLFNSSCSSSSSY